MKILGVIFFACVLLACSHNHQVLHTESQPGFQINGKAVALGQHDIDGRVTLVDSVSGDLNTDGREDQAVILRLDSTGSGVFYYLNVFINSETDGWYFTGEEFMGDRIRLDRLAIYSEGSVSPISGVAIHPDDYGKLLVAFYTYRVDQPFAEDPKLYIARHWKVESGQLQVLENY